MGINGLWNLIKDIPQRHTLLDFAKINGFSYASGTHGVQHIGVDISTLMNQNITFINPSQKPYAFNPDKPLVNFFYQLCRFSKAPVVFIFVFDGPERPNIKHQHKINTQSVPWWTEPCKEIIEAFGFYSHQAPGEAEAELAAMNNAGIISAVLGPDSDSFAFGAKTVMRRYKMLETYGVTRNGIVLVALISGGDYCKGVERIGAVNAAALARGGFGDSLEKGFRDNSQQELVHFLRTWSQELAHELKTNSLGLLAGKRPSMADILLSDSVFPDVKAIDLYFNPVTSTWSPPSADSSDAVAA
ncbi:hypothetical protein D9613_012120 [Agrocybe pediades]|uniref:XPG-I domain-containing protein n=1 Tax=Agrocybe pediades TaxID=84607 RepID=A0A8H4R1V2_9AGAR|nr:hypothetical protein D9613_012120 [Agrocybe pediades]